MTRLRTQAACLASVEAEFRAWDRDARETERKMAAEIRQMRDEVRQMLERLG